MGAVYFTVYIIGIIACIAVARWIELDSYRWTYSSVARAMTDGFLLGLVWPMLAMLILPCVAFICVFCGFLWVCERFFEIVARLLPVRTRPLPMEDEV